MNREAEQKRLVELIKATPHGTKTLGDVLDSLYIENVMVKHLIANGVIVPPCKVGDTVYYINGRYEKQGRKKVHIEFVDIGIVDNMVIGDKGVPQIDVCTDENEWTMWTMFDSEDDFGKTVFLTKEEAEQALRKEDKGK